MTEKNECKRKFPAQSQTIYGLGFIGALIYFIQHAGYFVAGVMGFLKAIVWPAVLVYRLFEFLNS